MDQVAGRVALIAGAVDGVGAAIAACLGGGGAKLALCDRACADLEALVSGLRAGGATAKGYDVDARDPASVQAVVGRVVEEFGRIDVLINNPAAPLGKPLAELAAAQFAATMDACLGAQFHFVRAVIPGMLRHRSGRIVGISSLDYLGVPGRVDLSAARAALFGMTRAIALEVARDGVTVNTVVKGDVTEDDVAADELQRRVASIPVKKLGRACDVARAVGFFASDASKYVTGQTLFVCGGKSVHFSLSV